MQKQNLSFLKKRALQTEKTVVSYLSWQAQRIKKGPVAQLGARIKLNAGPEFVKHHQKPRGSFGKNGGQKFLTLRVEDF